MSNIVQTFFMLFKSDSSELKKDLEDVTAKTEEFTEASKGSETQTKKTEKGAKDLSKAIDDVTESSKDNEEQTKKNEKSAADLAKAIGQIAGGYFTANSVLNLFKGSMRDTFDLSNIQNFSDVNVEKLDAWGRAFRRFGGDMASFRSEAIAFTMEHNTSLNTTLDFFLRMSDTLSRLSLPGAQIIGRQKGLSPQVVAFLHQGPAAVRAALKEQYEIGVTSDKDTQAIQELNKSLTRLSDATDALTRAYIELVQPLFSFLLRGATGGVNLIGKLAKVNEVGLNAVGDAAYMLTPNVVLDKIFGPEKPVEPVPVIPEVKNNQMPPLSFNAPAIPYLPPVIAPMANSQSRSLYFGDININSNTETNKELANMVVAKIEDYWQTNAQFDDGVVA